MGRKPTKFMVSENALRQVKIDDLKVDQSYQRGVVAGHKKIVAEFMKEALGIPLVGQREDGSLWIVDGQQRIEALKKLGKTTVRAEVFASSGPEHEAEVFKRVNKDRTRMRPTELFKAALAAGDEEAWAVKKIVEKYGFKIPLKLNTPDHTTIETLSKQIACVVALTNTYHRGGAEALEFVMRVLRDCWADDPMKNRDTIVNGLYSFWFRRDGEVDLDRLIPRCNTTTPAKMIYTAQQGVGDRAANMADVIERLYNKRSIRGSLRKVLKRPEVLKYS